MQCSKCQLNLPAMPLVICLCGNVVVGESLAEAGTIEPMPGVNRVCKVKLPPADTRGYDHAAICRTNQCGKYNASRDSCQILVNIGKSGSVSWLYTHPNTRCPNDPPMWTITDGSTNAAAMDPGASRTQRHGDALAIEQQGGTTAEDIAGR